MTPSPAASDRSPPSAGGPVAPIGRPAIYGLLCGLFGFLALPIVPALALGSWTLARARRDPSAAAGTRLAAGGIALAVLWAGVLATAWFTGAIGLDAFSSAARMTVERRGQYQRSYLICVAQSFLMDTGRYPRRIEEFLAPPPDLPGWRGPYVRDAALLHDPLGRPYQVVGQAAGFDLRVSDSPAPEAR